MFYISWGTKVYQSKEGIAADFCPICRKATGVEVRQIRSQNHVYNIGVGQGQVVGRLVHCLDCGSEWGFRPGTIETLVNPAAPVSLQTLLAETYPKYAVVNEERLKQEEIVRVDPMGLDPDERLSLIAEPFFVLENDVQQEDKQAKSWESMLGGLGCLGAIGFVIATLVAFLSSSVLWGLIFLVVSGVVAWLSFKLILAGTDRFMRRRIYPRLASCLAPLHPSVDELGAVMANIESKCASQTKLKDFLPVLEAARSSARQAAPVAR